MSSPPRVAIILMGAVIVIVGTSCIAYGSILIARANSSQDLELGVVDPVSTGTVVQGPEGQAPACTPPAVCQPSTTTNTKDTPPLRPLSVVSTISSFGDHEAIKAELEFTKAQSAAVKGDKAQLRSGKAELGSAAYDDGEELGTWTMRNTLDHAPSSMTWEEPLSRLSTKAGVIATIVLERSSGLVLQRKSISNAASLFTAQKPSIASKDADQDLSASPTEVDEFSTMVWKFMNAAGSLVNDLDSEDEVKLLRLRTKKHELVVVPDSKYILIVVHETTPS